MTVSLAADVHAVEFISETLHNILQETTRKDCDNEIKLYQR